HEICGFKSEVAREFARNARARLNRVSVPEIRRHCIDKISECSRPWWSDRHSERRKLRGCQRWIGFRDRGAGLLDCPCGEDGRERRRKPGNQRALVYVLSAISQSICIERNHEYIG